MKEYPSLFKKCYSYTPLKNIAEDVATGVSSGLDKAYVYSPDSIKKLHLENLIMRKLVVGGEIHRYALTPKSGKKLIYTTPSTNIDEYPNCLSALLPYKKQLLKRREASNGKIPWFALNWPRRSKLFERPKILIRQTADRIMATFDSAGWYCLKSGLIIQLPDTSIIKYEYLLGLLNSSLMKLIYGDLVGEKARVFPEVKPVQLFKLPIREIDFGDADDKRMHDKMFKLVERMMKLHKKLVEAKVPGEKERMKREIEATDRQIDSLVYELYGLTTDEIAIVEGHSK